MPASGVSRFLRARNQFSGYSESPPPPGHGDAHGDQPVTFRSRLASELLSHDSMWKRALRAVVDHVPASSAPWYRRADVWLLLGAIVLPFGWLLAVARF